MTIPITDQSVVVALDPISADLDGEAAMLNIKTGVYYGLMPGAPRGKTGSTR